MYEKEVKQLREVTLKAHKIKRISELEDKIDHIKAEAKEQVGEVRDDIKKIEEMKHLPPNCEGENFVYDRTIMENAIISGATFTKDGMNQMYTTTNPLK